MYQKVNESRKDNKALQLINQNRMWGKVQIDKYVN